MAQHFLRLMACCKRNKELTHPPPFFEGELAKSDLVLRKLIVKCNFCVHHFGQLWFYFYFFLSVVEHSLGQVA